MGTLKPVYDHPPGKVDGGLWTRLARLDLVENLFFGVALSADSGLSAESALSA